jgi:hypothetical protein
MLHALIVLAAEEAEPSKTAFYIAGGVLAAFAVVVSAVGIRSAGFASDQGTSRGVMALCALLVAAAMAMAVVTG